MLLRQRRQFVTFQRPCKVVGARFSFTAHGFVLEVLRVLASSVAEAAWAQNFAALHRIFGLGESVVSTEASELSTVVEFAVACESRGWEISCFR